MNKKFFILLPALGLFLGACQPTQPVTPPGPVETVTGVEVDHESLSLQVGQTSQLNASVKPISLDDRSVTWSSDHPEFAAVDASGMVTAVAVGVAHVRATANADQTKFAECEVTVTPEMVTVALTNPTEIMASTKVLKLGANQKNVGAWYYFTGDVDSNTRGETSVSWAEGVQVKLESAGTNTYYVSFGEGAAKQYFEMSDDHHFAIVSTPTAGREWSWNETYATVQRTIEGTTYLPGTYQTFTTISGCNLAQAASDFFFQFVYQTEPVAPETITLTAESDKIYQGGTLQVNAELAPAGAAGDLVWSVEGDEHVTIDQHGLVTATQEAALNASVTIKAAYAEDETVFGTLTVTVAEYINYGTLNEPLTIAEAKAIIDKFPTGTPEILFIKGVVTSSGAYTSFNNWDPIWLTDGVTEQAFEGFRLKDGSSDGSFKTTYAAANSLVGKTVTIQGIGTLYNGSVYETTSGADSKLMKVEDITINPTSIVLNPSEAFEMTQGGNKSVTAKLLPYGASGTVAFAVSPANQGVTYENGKVVATAQATTGNYTLTATCGSLSASVNFTVTQASADTYVSMGALSFNKDQNVVINNQLSDTTDPKITYSENGVTIVVKKGSSNNDVNVWQSSYSSCRWYVGHNVTISAAQAFKRVVLTCDSSYNTFKDGATGVIENVSGGASVSYGDGTIILELSTAATSITIVPDKQIRPSNVELFKLGA